MKMKHIKKLISYMVTAMMLIATTPALAQDNDALALIDTIPGKPIVTSGKDYNQTNDTHPPLKITPDKSELIRLDKDAGSIIIGNPSHLSVLADSAKTLVLVPQLPGATHITVLDKESNILMQRHVIVASPEKKYVRIRKSCSADTEGCEPTQIYYCPDMCHKVNVAQDVTASSDTSGESSSQISESDLDDLDAD